METSKSVAEIVRVRETNYITGTISTSKYVNKSMYEDIEKIDAYLNSTHTSGSTDSLGREKPFFNIVTAAANIWFRATDIDRKNIMLKASKSGEIFTSYLATYHLQNFMKRENFGAFLNDWGRVLSRYGSTVCKFVKADGRLYSNIIPWNRLIVDQIDFDSNPVIEILELTPAQLRMRQGYNQEMVEKLIDTVTARTNLDRTKKDNQNDYIRLYEIHGNLPLSLLTGSTDDDKEYVQQMHVISFVASKEKGNFDDFCLISGREEKSPYMITHLIKEEGQTLSIGAVQNLFTTQWMLNHSMKSIKDQLDLASKLIFQTSDGNFVGQNALSSIESGDILIHSLNQPLTQINNGSHDITSLQNFATQWKTLGNEINGISESMLGINPPSGTAWRQTEALLSESHGLFEMMTENKGIHIEEMMRNFIIPFLKTQMDTTEEVVATLDDLGVKEIEAKFIKNMGAKIYNQKVINSLIANQKPTADLQTEQNNIQQALSEQGNNRFIKPSDIDSVTWKKILKDFEWEVDVDVTGEAVDKQSMLTTLNTALQVVANPMYSQNETAQLIVNKILTTAGYLSPAEIPKTVAPITPAPVAPVNGAVGGTVPMVGGMMGK